jgi:hypothetical protein
VRRAARQRLLLAGGVAALLALAFWQWRHDQARQPSQLLALDPDAVRTVELRLAGAPTEHYARRDGRWWRTDGTPAPADQGRLGELAATAQAPVLAWRPAGDFDPARIGLAPPQAVLRLDGHVLEFGETAVTGPQRYVRVDGAHVALVPLRYAPRAAGGKRLTLN